MDDPNNSAELTAKIDELIRSITALTDSVHKSASASASAAAASEKSAKASASAAKAADAAGKATRQKIQRAPEKASTSLADEIAKQFEKVASVYSAKKAKTASNTAKKESAAKGQSPLVQGMKAAEAFNSSLGRSTAVLSHLNKSLGAIGQSFGALGKSLGSGTATTEQFADSVSSVGKSALGAAAIMGGPLVKAVSVAAGALLSMAVSVAKQSDAQFKIYQDLQKSGAASSDELDGVNSMLHNFGLGVANADKMLAVLAANAPGLASFAGTVADGSKRMSRVIKEIGDSGLRKTFNQIGLSTDEQRESTAAYINIQSQLGFAQTKTIKELTQSAAKYMIEQDALTKATGATRQEQEAAQKTAMSEEMFRNRQNRLLLEGKEDQAKAEMAAYKTMAAEFGPDVASQFGASLDGIITDFNSGLAKLTGTASAEIARRYAEGQISADQAADETRASIRSALTPGGVGSTLAMTGRLKAETGLGIDKISTAAFGRGSLVDRKEKIAAETEKTALAPGAAVAGQATMIETNIKVQSSLENLKQYGIAPVTWAMGKLAGVTGYLADKLNVGARGEKDGTESVSKELNSLFKNLPKYADGGIATGNASGHLAILHGTEAVIPLKGGSIPVQFSGGMAGAQPGPVFDPKNETNYLIEKSNEELVKSNVTLDKILTAIMGGATLGGSGAAAMAQEALAEHDHAHPHEPTKAVDPELAKQIGKIVNPLEKMNQTSGFGNRMMDGKVQGHGAIDLAGKIGDKIMAPISGVARVLTEKESGGYGNMVEVTDEKTGVKHMLAHMDKTMVKTGEIIKAGQQIGTVGNTGKSTGAHLHHEMRDKAGNKIDPSQFYSGPGFGSTAGGAATGNPNIARQGRRSGATQYPAPGMAGELGSMSEKYETGGRGSGTVGWDKVGGTSYGKYQIASKVGAMKDFLKFAEQSGRGDVAAKLRAAGAESDTGGTSGKSVDVWKQMAAGGELGDLEHQFIKQKSFDPAMAGLKNEQLKKMIEGDKGLKEMMWSTAVQHGGGGASGIMNKVYKEGMSKEDLVKATYAERGTRFGGSTAEVQKSVKNRFASEQGDVLAMMGMPSTPGAPAGGMMAGAAPGKRTTGSLRSALGLPEGGSASANPVASLTQSVMGMLGLGGAPTTGTGQAGITAGGAPGAIGSDIAAITQAMEAQTVATQTAITSGMENLTTQLVDKLGGAGGTNDPAIPALLSEMIAAQRDNTTAINKLIQVSTA
jgi:hypothetical protein